MIQSKNPLNRIYSRKKENSERPEETENLKENICSFIEYTEQCLETFEQKPFCDVDALVFSWLSYIHFPDICIGDEPVRLADLFKAELFDDMFSPVVAVDETKALFTAAAASPRFRDIGISHYVSRLDAVSLKQFSAVNFHISDDLRVIAYRGTDKFFVGWKEDLCLILEDPVESQKSSLRYIKRCSDEFDGKIITCGHSKGGNLAVYSAALCDDSVRKRITKVYSFDGPGTEDEELLKAAEAISDRTIKIVPQSSLVGLLMEKNDNYRIVKCDGRGILQHMAYHWHISDGDFLYANELNYESRLMSNAINTWISGIGYEEREQVVESLFELIDGTETEAITDFRDDLPHSLPAIRKSFSEMKPEVRKSLLDNMKTFLSASVKTIPRSFDSKQNHLTITETDSKI